jgi:hypothetical protein
LGNLSDFSGRIKPLLKFIKDSNVESVPGFLTLLLLELDVGTIEKNVHYIPSYPHAKIGNFLSKLRQPF